MRLTTKDVTTTKAALVRIRSTAPAPPSTATDAYEPMLTATRKKKTPCPVGSPWAGGARSVTLSGLPCAVASGVKTFSATVALVSAFVLATSSSGAVPEGTKAPESCRSMSRWCAASRSGTVRTSSDSPAAAALSWIVCASAAVLGPAPTTATGMWCGEGLTKAPR
ncbi:hypothetical protein GA0115246_109053 [Streptomyces sp. SolWspMP-sol7th]|nr:hypothetical protein GA0115246_109053 [Streptomyces sp. SolWspMP-sol7th]